MLVRGFTRRCARCGSGHLFRNYLMMKFDCPQCHLHFEREQGYFAGALAINFILTGGVFISVLLVALILTIPEVPVIPIVAIVVPIAAIMPIVFYPFSKTIWVAIDRGYLAKLSDEERSDEHYGN
jgi:uncharacterized protein (DUF983 family)